MTAAKGAGGRVVRRTTCADHTMCPEGYLAWHAWAEKKAKRHRQVRCDECGLWAIWRRKVQEAET